MKKRHLLTILTLFITLAATVCCDKPQEVMLDTCGFVSISTNSEGAFDTLRTDWGYKYAVRKAQSQESLLADTTYRVICRYVINGEQADILEYIKPITQPWKPDIFSRIKKDPMRLESAWISGGYLNITLKIMALNKPHYFAVIDYSTSDRVRFEFYHDENGDVRSYEQDNYVSIPLDAYTFLKTGDIVELSIKDYDGVTQNYQVTFK